ncbi:MAG TPA: HigA family addiction module antitoxin [Lachnospiraceae bacterium]|nr:HigA family addiction module antitoxin [Lachnospiraceae bacterium]
MNKTEYGELSAFHPGYYIAEIIEDMGITQEEFAVRMGTTAKTLSKLVNGQINLSNDLAMKLSIMMGTSVEVWLNLQKNYDRKIIEIEGRKDIDGQIQISRLIDYSYFVKVAHLKETRKPQEKVENLCGYFKISDLKTLENQDYLVNFRTGIKNVDNKNVINARAWLQTALNIGGKLQTEEFNARKLMAFLPEIRSMTVQNPEVFLPRLRKIFSESGIAFVLLPHLKNSGINGAVKWYTNSTVLLAVNDRRCYADTFWFTLFHEIKHALQQKRKVTFVYLDEHEADEKNRQLEDEADAFAQDYLIPAKELAAWSPDKYVSDADICMFARKIGIHPGIVAGRLQNEGIIPQNRCTGLKEKYKITLLP